MPFTYILFQFLNGTTLFHPMEPDKADAIVARWRESVGSGTAALFENVTDPTDPTQSFTFASSSLLYVRHLTAERGDPMWKNQQAEAARLAAGHAGIQTVGAQVLRG